MAFIRKKKIKGKEYFYLQESIIVNNKVKTRHIKYLGSIMPNSYEFENKKEKMLFNKIRHDLIKDKYDNMIKKKSRDETLNDIEKIALNKIKTKK